MIRLRSFKLDDIINSLYSKGGADKDTNHYADILDYSDMEGKWTRVRKMSEKRNFPAASIVEFDEFKDHCQWS